MKYTTIKVNTILLHTCKMHKVAKKLLFMLQYAKTYKVQKQKMFEQVNFYE